MKHARDSRLILVLCADTALLDVTLRAVARRLSGRPHVVFAEPLTTHALPAGSGDVMPASRLAALQRQGALALSWRDGPALRGLSNSLLAQLACGTSVIAGVSPVAAADARALWPDTRIVRLGGRTDPLRSPLGPRACLTRIAGNSRPPALARMLAAGIDAEVHATGHLGDTVGRLSEVLLCLLPDIADTAAKGNGRRRRVRAAQNALALGGAA